jgi:hypothetical protein
MIRTLVCWLYAICSLLSIWNAFKSIAHFVRRQSETGSFPNLLIASLFLILAVLYAVAWWTTWKKKSSSRAWGIAAFVTYVLLPILGVTLSRSISVALAIMFAVGVIGLVVLLWPAHKEPPEDESLA